MMTDITTVATGPAYAQQHPRTVSVDGEVSVSAAMSKTELRHLPQTTVTFTMEGRQVTDTGVPAENLVKAAEPAYPTSIVNTKNELLRVTVTVRAPAITRSHLPSANWTPTLGIIRPCWR
jgi:hypothetical protein